MRAQCIGRCDIRRVLDGSPDAIEGLLADFRRRCACTWTVADWFAAELMVREALNNAALHGSKGRPGAEVVCRLRMRPASFTFGVADSGDGFDWRHTRDAEAELDACSGRGMSILRAYATRVRFNEKGNVVVVRKNFRREES